MSDFTLEQKQQIQKIAVAETTQDNPLIPWRGNPTNIKALNTNKKEVTLAINELLESISSVEDTSNKNIQMLAAEVLGDFINDNTLLDKIKNIDENIILAVNKLYSMIVGDPEDPTEFNEESVYEAINEIKESIKHVSASNITVSESVPENPQLNHIWIKI